MRTSRAPAGIDRRSLEKYNYARLQGTDMTLSLEEDCPECGEDEFYKAASTRLQLGRKMKWHCANCDFGFVTIDGIDTRV